jgi:hypothetical protein
MVMKSTTPVEIAFGRFFPRAVNGSHGEEAMY